jgi:hypothetical protein
MRLSQRPGFEKPPRTLDDAKAEIATLRSQLAEARAKAIEECAIKIGTAICNPPDNYSAGLWKAVTLIRALSPTTVLY